MTFLHPFRSHNHNTSKPIKLTTNVHVPILGRDALLALARLIDGIKKGDVPHEIDMGTNTGAELSAGDLTVGRNGDQLCEMQ